MRHSHVLPVVLWMLLCCLPPFSIAMVALKILTRLLLSDDDTKFEEILIGSHTRTRTHTHIRLHPSTSLGSTPSILSFRFLLFATVVADAAVAAACCFAIYIVRLA